MHRCRGITECRGRYGNREVRNGLAPEWEGKKIKVQPKGLNQNELTGGMKLLKLYFNHKKQNDYLQDL